nr:hypothetical protein [Crucivirus sp.]
MEAVVVVDEVAEAILAEAFESTDVEIPEERRFLCFFKDFTGEEQFSISRLSTAPSSCGDNVVVWELIRRIGGEAERFLPLELREALFEAVLRTVRDLKSVVMLELCGSWKVSVERVALRIADCRPMLERVGGGLHSWKSS